MGSALKMVFNERDLVVLSAEIGVQSILCNPLQNHEMFASTAGRGACMDLLKYLYKLISWSRVVLEPNIEIVVELLHRVDVRLMVLRALLILRLFQLLLITHPA